eukprot:4409003-Prymnesium_polylepis.1
MARDATVIFDERARLGHWSVVRQKEVDPHVNDEDSVDHPVDEEHGIHLCLAPQDANFVGCHRCRKQKRRQRHELPACATSGACGAAGYLWVGSHSCGGAVHDTRSSHHRTHAVSVLIEG